MCSILYKKHKIVIRNIIVSFFFINCLSLLVRIGFPFALRRNFGFGLGKTRLVQDSRVNRRDAGPVRVKSNSRV